jgi:kumamolisin
MARIPLPGSERRPMPGAAPIGKADPSETLQVSVLLRRRNASALAARVQELARGGHAEPPLSHADFEREFGADPADLAAVRRFAAEHGLSVVEEHPARRTVLLSGTVAQVDAAFGVELQTYRHSGGQYRGRTGSIQLPDTLDGVVEAVLGLDDRPAARTHFRRHDNGRVPHAAAASSASYTPVEIAKFYDFPQGTGEGQCVALIELGGGEKSADLKTYFAGLGIKPAPKVTVVSVDKAKNKPTGSVDGPDGEVMLDIEVVGAVAPGAHIVVYFAPNTDAGFLNAITTATHDTTNKPSVISISWGGPESSWTQQSLTSFDSAFQAAATLGVTVCVAAGDNGSSDGGTGDNVDFPGSSPHVLCCGGTTIQISGSTISDETVWNDGAEGGATGGGVSAVFALPAWQEGLNATLTAGGSEALTNRGVPDVAGDADPETGYRVRVDGSDAVFGGTSAVAPLWAGLIARINEANGSPVGFINAKLYAAPSALNDVTQGNNGDFAASPGWDACTGLGSPDGVDIAALFDSAA